MFTIAKRFDFSASHVLTGLPLEHPCGRLHGHNYAVEFILEGDIDEVGFIVDYRELDPIKRWIDATFDHRHLNDVVAFNPTAERLARWLFEVWSLRYPALVAVRVSETPKTWAEYRERRWR